MTADTITRADLLGAAPSPAWAEQVDAIALDDVLPMRALLRAAALDSGIDDDALYAAVYDTLSGIDEDAALARLSARVRADYERKAPRHEGRVRDEHAARFHVPWSDPCADPSEFHPLARRVAAVYAIEAWARGLPSSRICYYLRAALEGFCAPDEVTP